MKNEQLGLVVYGANDRVYDINNKYGTFGTADVRGCHMWAFTSGEKTNYAPYNMSPEKGIVTMNGKEIPFEFKRKTGIWNPWIVAVDLTKLHMKQGETYEFVVSDFKTETGETIEPVKTVFTTVKDLEITADYKYHEHDEMTLKTACEGAVLLKNDDNVLPIRNTKLNIFGDAYYKFYIMSAGAGCINPRFSVDFTEGLAKYGEFKLNQELYDFYAENFNIVPDTQMLERAKEYSDTAVIIITRGSSENIDNQPIKGEYYLTDDEELMIKRVSEVFEKTVLVLNTGYTIDVRAAEKYNIKAVLWFGYGGQYAVRALAEILTGKENPSGRLPDTWAYDYFDHPSSKNYILPMDVKENCEEPHIVNVYEEGMYIGYRYFDTFNVPMAFPFGKGLSYTKFEYKFKSASYADNELRVFADVKNIGNRSGKYSLLLYLSEPDGRLEKCAHKLVDFQKTKLLEPGESETLEFSVKDDELSSFDTKTASMIMEKGEYKVYLGEEITNISEVYSFIIEKEKIIRKLHNYCVAKQDIKELSKNDINSYPKGEHSFYDCNIEGFDFSDTKRKHFETTELTNNTKDIIYYDEILKNPDLIDDFIAQMSVEELARLSVCSQAWSMFSNGAAGSVFTLEKYKMKNFITADGNSCLRISDKTTGFPSSNMICASFNRDMAYAVGKVVAEEAYESKVHMILAPGMNIHRNPLCGRHPEYFSEDPILCGTMAGYHLKGLQDNNVAGVIKHIIANNAEFSRMRSHSVVGERTLREIYLKCFEIAMRIDMPKGLMTSYNATNDCYTACDEELIIGIFREELGFEGYVMTDWGSYSTCDLVKAVASGNCWMTPGSPDTTYTAPIIEGVNNGKIELSRLQDNVKRLVSVMAEHTNKQKEG